MIPNLLYKHQSNLKDELSSQCLLQKQFGEASGRKGSNISGIISRNKLIPIDLLKIISESIIINEAILRGYQDRRRNPSKIKVDNPMEDYAQNSVDKFGAIVSVKSLLILKDISDLKNKAIRILELLLSINELGSPMPQIILSRVSYEKGKYRFTTDVSRLIINKVRKEDGMIK